ncbi:MFS transporter [Tatumella citrea]|uniref:MFS transporter n=1 Tax=Tatumella citrea TaxID=53336 RepID=A0A1Y0LAS5_TATCI|nr:MFS transporter [Tatumella citrea]ARU94780.1 MFS transporter [Tatumella citrea]ARU98818.1 MFS transporter [Tatumella citrea]
MSDSTLTPANNQKPSSFRWVLFGAMFFLVAVNLMDRITLSIGMPFIKDEFSLSPTMQGLILSSFFWSYALLQIPGGWMLDRFGPRKVVTGALFGWGFFQAIIGFATGGISMMLARIGLGVMEAPVSPSGAKLSSRWLTKSERGRGAVVMDSGSPLGVAFGGIIVAHLIVLLDSWRIAFVLVGLFTMLLGLFAWKIIRDRPEWHPKVNQQELDYIHAGNITQADDSDERPTQGLGISWLTMIAIMIGRASWGMVYWGLLTWGPSYLAQAQGLKLAAIGNSTFLIFIVGTVGCLFSGFFTDFMVKKGVSHNVALKSMLSVSGIVGLGALYALSSITDPEKAVILLAVAAFFLMFGSLYWSFPAILAPKDRVGMVGGLMNMANSVAGILVPILVGVILQATGSFKSVLVYFAICAGCYTLGTLCINFNKVPVTRKQLSFQK